MTFQQPKLSVDASRVAHIESVRQSALGATRAAQERMNHAHSSVRSAQEQLKRAKDFRAREKDLEALRRAVSDAEREYQQACAEQTVAAENWHAAGQIAKRVAEYARGQS